MLQGAVVPQDLVQQGTPRASVAIYKWVNSLKLGMEHRGFGDGVSVVPPRIGREVFDALGDMLGTRRYKQRPMRTVSRAAHPDLLGPELSPKALARRVDEGLMNRTNSLRGQPTRLREPCASPQHCRQ